MFVAGFGKMPRFFTTLGDSCDVAVAHLSSLSPLSPVSRDQSVTNAVRTTTSDDGHALLFLSVKSSSAVAF